MYACVAKDATALVEPVTTSVTGLDDAYKISLSNFDFYDLCRGKGKRESGRIKVESRVDNMGLILVIVLEVNIYLEGKLYISPRLGQRIILILVREIGLYWYVRLYHLGDRLVLDGDVG